MNWTNSSPDISTSDCTKEGELLIGNFVLFLGCLTVFEALQLNVFETYKECAINKASVFLSSCEKSSQLAMSVSYSTEVSFFLHHILDAC